MKKQFDKTTRTAVAACSCLIRPLGSCYRSIAILFALTILAGGAQSAMAIVIPTLTLTEVSSTTLNYSGTDGFGSGSVAIVMSKTAPPVPVPDQWNGTITGPLLTGFAQLTGSWQEPGSTLWNNVTVTFTPAGTKPAFWNVTVISDAATAQFPNHYADGATATYYGTVGNFSVIFIDQAAASEVPEGGATVIMLSLAVGCCAIVRRRITAA